MKSATKFLCMKTFSSKVEVVLSPFLYLMVHEHWQEAEPITFSLEVTHPLDKAPT